jgi:hypothetical protein
MITIVLTIVTLLGSIIVSVWFVFERWTYLRYEGNKSFWDLLTSSLVISSNHHISKDTHALKEQKRQNTLDKLALVFMAHGQPRAVVFTPASAHEELPLLPSDQTATLNLHFSPCGTRLVTSRYAMLYSLSPVIIFIRKTQAWKVSTSWLSE